LFAKPFVQSINATILTLGQERIDASHMGASPSTLPNYGGRTSVLFLYGLQIEKTNIRFSQITAVYVHEQQ